MSPVVVAGAATAAAAALAVPSRPTGSRPGSPRAGGALLAVLAGVAVLAGPVAVGAGVAGAALWLRARGGRARERETVTRLEALRRAATLLVAELRAGAPAATALRAAAAGTGPVADAFARAATAAELDADAAAVLAAESARLQLPALRALGACWTLTGAGVATTDALGAVLADLRAELALRATVEAELAGPRATARTLVALPGFGLALAGGLGAHPVQFLLHSPAGLGCAAGAVLLDLAGYAWVRALGRRAVP